ncbi:MAG: nuclear transport factor 2 family protein [Candidatus Omnitrophica bacterium]|nr:nuclear transport factor 2 family protein [Candidatus Omnitrophota bacterium]MBU1923207.1 nuclear transport factor 2 family protein [Candidatus Omnitrophota bacterium]
MRKLLWFIVLALTILVGYSISPALAQEKKEILEAKKVVDGYLQAFAQQDINSIMSKVSSDYSSKDKKGNQVDYAKLKANLENQIDIISKKYIDYSIARIQITESDIKDNHATIWIVYSWKRFDLVNTKEENGRTKKTFFLVKEDSSWKIVQVVGKTKKSQKQGKAKPANS